jgi:hypothetical protein
MKAGDLVVIEPGAHHAPQFRRAIPRIGKVVAVDLPWVEVRCPSEQRPPVMTFLVPASEVRHAD